MYYAIFREACVAGNVDYLGTMDAVNDDEAERYAEDTWGPLGHGERFIIEEEDDEHILLLMKQEQESS